MKVFIIGSVRLADDEYRTKLDQYTKSLEDKGYKVHLPHRDTDQFLCGLDICMQNLNAIIGADEVHVFYNSKSQGTHFDLGMAFTLGKKIVVVENEEYGKGKCFSRMIKEWEEDVYFYQKIIRRLLA